MRAGQTEGGDNGAAQEMAKLKEAADIVEIMNLHAQYAHAVDSGRLDEVAELNTETSGRGYYYQDPVTNRLHVNGTPVDVKGQPLKDFPGCVMFGRENVKGYLAGAGISTSNSIRPHVDGLPGPGSATRHVVTNMYVEVTGDTAKLRDFYSGQTISESDSVRTPKRWEFNFRKVIAPKHTPDRPCVIADPKFPIPPAGSLGGCRISSSPISLRP